MANNCYNYLEIEGTEEDIKRLEECIIVRNIEGEDRFDEWNLRKVIPVETDERGYYKVDSIYDVWGTKWFDGEDFESRGTSATLTFDTAWSPSLPVTLEMSRRFNLKIKHSYEESGCNFEGDYNVDNGEVVFEEERNYRPMCEGCDEKFDSDDMIYNEDEGTYKCKRCGDELTGIVMDKLDKIKGDKKDK